MTAPPPGYSPGPPQPGPPTGPQPQIGPPSGPIPTGQQPPGPPHPGPPTGPQPQVGPPPPVGPYQPRGPHPQFGQYGAPPPAPPRPRGTRWTPGLFAALLFLIATAAAVWGTFERIYTFRSEAQRGGGTRVTENWITWWDLGASGLTSDEPTYGPYGLLAAVAAGALLVAAVLALMAYSTRRPGAVTGVRVASALGVGMLAGATGVHLIQALDRLSDVNNQQPGPGQTLTYDIGLGIWLLVGAVGAGLIGLILVLTRPRPAPAAGRLEPATPRMGFPAPYGPGSHQPPAPQQFHQQPAHAGPQPTSGPPTGPEPSHGPATGPEPIHSPLTGPQPQTGPPTQSPPDQTQHAAERARPAESGAGEPATRPAEPEQPPERP